MPATLVNALLAALPVVLAFALIGSRRVAAWKAALAGAALALALATAAWSLPWPAALASAGYGVAGGLFPIVYIIFGSLLLYNLTGVLGWAERLRQSLSHLATDRDYLLLFIGFGFAAFLDSTAGFLTPVTIATALLTGLGVPALQAASYAVVASSLPPVFGAMGIPVLVLADVGGVALGPLVRAQATVAALLFAAFPAWLTFTFGGAAALRRLGPTALAAGLAYAGALWLTAVHLSPYPAGLAASVAALAAMGLTRPGRRASRDVALRDVALPWWPYGVLMAAVILWSLPPLARRLGFATLSLPVPKLPAATWRVELLASPGTAILVATALVALLGRARRGALAEALRLTARQLRFPVVNMLAMFALAQVMSQSGMTTTLGQAAARAGRAFPLVSPFLSWLGAAIAGSNTASNALLGRLQAATAGELGLDPVWALAIAGAASPLGKMVAPQVLSAAAAAGRVEGQEGQLLRVGLLHSLAWAALLGAGGALLAR